MNMPTRRFGVIGAVIAAAATTVSFAGGAAAVTTGAGWSPDHQLESNYSVDYGVDQTQTVIDGRGDAATVWPDSGSAGHSQKLWVATRAAGQPWSAKHQLMTGYSPVIGLGIGGHGRTVVVYKTADTVKWAQHTLHGSWVAKPIPNQAASSDTLMSFAMATSGWGVLAYVHNQLGFVRKLTPSGRWQAPVRVTPAVPPRGTQGTGAHNVRAVIDNDGEVVATWQWVTKDTQVGQTYTFKRGGLTKSGARKPIIDEGNVVAGLQTPYNVAQSASGHAVSFNTTTGGSYDGGQTALLRLADHVWRTYTIPTTGDYHAIVDVAVTDSTASVYWMSYTTNGPADLWVAHYRGTQWSAPAVVHHFAAGEAYGLVYAAGTPSMRIVSWESLATPGDTSTVSLHLRTRINGQRFDQTVPGSVAAGLTAVGDHASFVFAAPNSSPGGSALLVRTR